jgi:hypothetical protein
MSDFVFDPRVFIQPPLWDCPFCKAPASYGVLMIHARSYRRRCRNCWQSAEFELPPAPKKIVYLDQNVISNFVKTFHAQAAGGRTVEPFWSELFREIELLGRLQLLVCPDFQTHRDESAMTPYAEPLHGIYRHLSNGATFEFAHEVRDRQMLAYLDNWLAGEPDRPPPIDRAHAIHGQLDGWQERYRIDFPWRQDTAWVDELRTAREQTSEKMTELHERWRSAGGFRFDEAYAQELRAFGTMMLQLHVNHVQELVEMTSGWRTFDPERALPPPATQFVLAARERMRQYGVPEGQLWERLREFLQASTLDLVPYLRISTLLWAALARKGAAGQVRPPNKGMMNDVKTAATVLPYCDALFVDNEIAALLADEPLRTRIDYGTRLFSNNTRDDFLDYLHSLRAEISADYAEALANVYGENWLRPTDQFFRDDRTA